MDIFELGEYQGELRAKIKELDEKLRKMEHAYLGNKRHWSRTNKKSDYKELLKERKKILQEYEDSIPELR